MKGRSICAWGFAEGHEIKGGLDTFCCGYSTCIIVFLAFRDTQSTPLHPFYGGHRRGKDAYLEEAMARWCEDCGRSTRHAPSIGGGIGTFFLWSVIPNSCKH